MCYRRLYSISKEKLLNAISKDKDFISGGPNKPQNFKLENLSTLHYKAPVYFGQKTESGEPAHKKLLADTHMKTLILLFIVSILMSSCRVVWIDLSSPIRTIGHQKYILVNSSDKNLPIHKLDNKYYIRLPFYCVDRETSKVCISSPQPSTEGSNWECFPDSPITLPSYEEEYFFFYPLKGIPDISGHTIRIDPKHSVLTSNYFTNSTPVAYLGDRELSGNIEPQHQYSTAGYCLYPLSCILYCSDVALSVVATCALSPIISIVYDLPNSIQKQTSSKLPEGAN